MKKLLFSIITAVSFAAGGNQTEITPYSQALIKKVFEIFKTETFKINLSKKTAHRPTPGTIITYMQTLVLEELKKQGSSCDELDVRSLVADLGIVQFMGEQETAK